MKKVPVVFLALMVLATCSPEKKAMKNFKYGNFQDVIGYYENVLKSQPNNGKANYYLAESYRESNRIKEAEKYYAKAGGEGLNRDTIQFYYSKSLQANGKY